MRKMIFIAVALSGIVVSCAKSGTSSGNTPPPAGTFQPVTAGSQWSYQVTEVFNPSSSLLLTAAAASLGLTFPSIDTAYTMNVMATGKDTTIGAMSFAILSTDDQNNSEILSSQQGTDYYGLGIIPQINIAGIGGTTSDQTLLYFKDTAVGATWTQSVLSAGSTPGTTDTTVYTFTITALSQTVSAGGTTYTNVTQETVKVLPGGISAFSSVPGFPTGVDLSISGNYYYAKGIGLVKVDVNSSLYGFQYTENLTSYTIK